MSTTVDIANELLKHLDSNLFRRIPVNDFDDYGKIVKASHEPFDINKHCHWRPSNNDDINTAEETSKWKGLYVQQCDCLTGDKGSFNAACEHVLNVESVKFTHSTVKRSPSTHSSEVTAEIKREPVKFNKLRTTRSQFHKYVVVDTIDNPNPTKQQIAYNFAKTIKVSREMGEDVLESNHVCYIFVLKSSSMNSTSYRYCCL